MTVCCVDYVSGGGGWTDIRRLAENSICFTERPDGTPLGLIR